MSSDKCCADDLMIKSLQHTNDFIVYLSNSIPQQMKVSKSDGSMESISVRSTEEEEEDEDLAERAEKEYEVNYCKGKKKKRTPVLSIFPPAPPPKEAVVEDLALTQTLKKIQLFRLDQQSDTEFSGDFGPEEAEFVRCLQHVEDVFTEPGTWNPAEVLSNEEVYKLFNIEAAFSGCLMKALSYILHDFGKFESVMKELISQEVLKAPSSFEILRSNSDQVRSVSAVCKALGRRLIMTAVKPVVEDILNLPADIDLFYFNITDASEEVLSKLIPYVERILTATIHSLTITGCQQFLDLSLIRQMCKILSNEASIKFPCDKSGIGVVTLLFLRFICPSVINPASFGIPVELNSNGQKTLIGLAKLIQSIAGSYSQTESLDDKPQAYREFVWKMLPIFDRFFAGLAGSNMSIGKLPKECNWEQCVRIIQTYLELISANVKALELISPNIGTMSKSGGGFFSNKTRKLLLSLVHAKLYYMRKDDKTAADWTGCIDLKNSRFADIPKNQWKGKFSKGNYIKVSHLLGDDMLLKSWKKRNGEFISGAHDHMLFWEHDRTSMLKPLVMIQQAQKSLGVEYSSTFQQQ